MKSENTNTPFFILQKNSIHTKARIGSIFLKNIPLYIQTPIFMPVATVAAFKTLTFEDITEMDYSLILHNTYHLTLRPGIETIETFGGIKNLTKWNKGLLTDSGGFQVFSLQELRKIMDIGVEFKDPIRGNKHLFTPKSTIDRQISIGSDIIMPLDECIPANSSFDIAQKAQIRTTKWAKKAKEYILTKKNAPALFGIVQGNIFPELRTQSCEDLISLDFDGYSIGGLSVGESTQDMYKMTELCTSLLPENKPRYLMGVGFPENLVEGVHLGVDMFDCVIPTRNARHGQAFTHLGRLNLNNTIHTTSDSPIDLLCSCKICTTYSRGYIHHLLKAKEMTAFSLLSYHNLFYISNLMKEIRHSITNDTFLEFRDQFYAAYNMGTPTSKPGKDKSQ